ncbi:GSCOCG00007229001-RA-CDS [Cotesia congregata]|uniref:Uncharacterized protein n=1 Tax=Cotesia congregata TaxID=51543 RepID=A0A8J2H1M1_COTCN|nr:GSCOCG00007229001-RA-CDS [Cotesia congregata]CAG5073906.1 Protein of unknown function [Cotesia congregata]
MSDKSVKVFAVVEFDECIGDEKSVELIPMIWLAEDEMSCLWTPEDEGKNVQKLIEKKIAPGSDWQRFPVRVIRKAKSFEQGMRRLKRSFETPDVDSSEAEKRRNDDQVIVMSSQNFASELNTSSPMKHQKTASSGCKNKRKDNDGENACPPPKKPKIDLTCMNDLGLFLKSIIEKEGEKTRQFLSLAITERYRQELANARSTANNPNNSEAWKIIGDDMPFSELGKFVEFDQSLEKDEEKKSSLMAMFKMVTVGSTTKEHDVATIISKVIKKVIQLEYSATGKRSKGVGKKSFKDTETFKVMDKFLLAKYANSAGIISTITALSNFLSGAKDREGGRAHRDENRK